jgi:hypothetical protein
MRTDKTNCGVCGNRCSEPYCVEGQCSPCPSGMTMCDGKCVYLGSDRSNCGACGTQCAEPTPFCGGGQCSCPPERTICGGTCAYVPYDAANCGACGNACTGPTPYCVEGRCSPCASSQQSMCNGVCAPILMDSSNCGACGNVCPTGTVCSNGQCFGCGQNQCLTPGGGYPNTWFCDSKNSDLNCGACGNSCFSPLYICVSGWCQLKSCTPGSTLLMTPMEEAAAPPCR